MKATKEEIKTLKDLQNQRDGLRKLLGDLHKDETIAWRALDKKYKLDLQHHDHIINFETREITRTKGHKNFVITPGNN